MSTPNPKSTPLLRISHSSSSPSPAPSSASAAPRRSVKFVAIAGALVGALLVAPIASHASVTYGAMLALLNDFQNRIQTYLTGQITTQTTQAGDRTGTQVAASGAAVQAEVKNAAGAQIQSQVAIAEAQAMEAYRQDVLEKRRKLEQPATTCQTAKTAEALSAADPAVRANTLRATAARVGGSRPVPLRNLDGSTAVTVAATGYTLDGKSEVLSKHDYTMQNFCSEQDVARGRCTRPTDFPNGDVNASLLFTGTDSTDTYVPRQEVAVTAFIERIVNGMPVELLNDPKWDRTPQGKMYIEQVRRYSAFMALSTHSLNSIANNRKPQGQLGTRVFGPSAAKPDMSRAEVISEFVRSKFSSRAVADMATAEEPHKILRELAQTNAMRLAMELEALRSAERTEALAAAQLALLTENQFGQDLARAKSLVAGSGVAAR